MDDDNNGLQDTHAFHDFYHPTRDPDCSTAVVKLYRHNFPALYAAVDQGEIRTASGDCLILKGDTLFTWHSAIRKFHGQYFPALDGGTQNKILAELRKYSDTAQKKIRFTNENEKGIVNNHQLGNMMPFPSSLPSMNTLRAGQFHDYFDRFLHEVRDYYDHRDCYRQETGLQRAIWHQHGYFDFFGSYTQYIRCNLLQDLDGVDLWGITDFTEYLRIANYIIDRRGKRHRGPPATCAL